MYNIHNYALQFFVEGAFAVVEPRASFTHQQTFAATSKSPDTGAFGFLEELADGVAIPLGGPQTLRIDR